MPKYCNCYRESTVSKYNAFCRKLNRPRFKINIGVHTSDELQFRFSFSSSRDNRFPDDTLYTERRDSSAKRIRRRRIPRGPAVVLAIHADAIPTPTLTDGSETAEEIDEKKTKYIEIVNIL